jgi:hypothetical protein
VFFYYIFKYERQCFMCLGAESRRVEAAKVRNTMCDSKELKSFQKIMLASHSDSDSVSGDMKRSFYPCALFLSQHLLPQSCVDEKHGTFDA